MKLLSDISRKYVQKDQEPKIVHAIQDLFTLKHLEYPIMSSDAVCPMCGGSNGMTCLIDPRESDQRSWFCVEPNCLTAVVRSQSNKTRPTLKEFRAILWPLFCEKNGIGNIHHDVKFEKIEQDKGKIDYLLKFSKLPRGIIVMQGDKGAGKTYCSMGVCELFTRSNSSALFYSHETLKNAWLKSASDHLSTFRDDVLTVNLLVIDDFGTKEPTPGFMEFFMHVIDSRMQWTNRGTIITTNLDDDKMSEYCGEALSDRLRTAQFFEFKQKSKRRKQIL